METSILPLELPWGLYEEVTPVKTGQVVRLSATGVPALALDETLKLQYARHRHQPFRAGSPIQWGARRLRLWALPSAQSSGEEQIDLRIHHGHGKAESLSLVITDNLGRHDKDKAQQQHPINARALDREMLVAVIIDQMLMLIDLDRSETAVQGQIRGWVRSDWRRIAEVLLAERDVDEPRMALIVRHAQTLHRLVGELGRHPRRVLSRNRRLQPVQRIQEMDSACLAWYVRQPGRTPLEKAGARQALMAVVREETIDTPENRVLRDFLARTVRAAESYLGANRNLAGSTRYGEVSRYGKTCSALLRRPEFAEVREIAGVIKPNYVLTSDPRYRRIWEAYQALLRRQDDEDEAWTWQGRLWSDMTTLAIHTALLTMLETVALSPVYLRKEQDHGSWLGVQGCSGIFANAERVFMLYAAERAPDEIRARYAMLAPQLIIRPQFFGAAPHKDLLVWSIMPRGANRETLDELTHRLDRAIANWHLDPQRSFRDFPKMRGLLVMAPETHDGALKTATHGNAIGVELPLVGAGFIDGLRCLAEATARGDLP